MESERLFEKIKNTVLSETSGTEEYDPDKIWRDIARKRKQKAIWLWWPYAAAAVFILCGIFIWTEMNPKKVQIAVLKVNKFETVPDVLTEDTLKPDAGQKAENRIEAAFEKKNSYSNQVVQMAAAKPLNFTEVIDSTGIVISDNDSLASKNKLTIAISATEIKVDSHDVSKVETEKVLIADISIPEDKTENYPALWQIFEQARKERQARKMRLQLDNRLRKPALWSFVHHSFVQYPAGRFPEGGQKPSN